MAQKQNRTTRKLSKLPLTKQRAEELRDRQKYEDDLLNKRTMVVLTFNGLMANAAVISGENDARIWIAVILLLFDIAWLSCSIEASRFIRGIGKDLGKLPEDVAPSTVKYHKAFVDSTLLSILGLRLGPTLIVGVVMPLLLTIGWFAAIIPRLLSLFLFFLRLLWAC